MYKKFLFPIYILVIAIIPSNSVHSAYASENHANHEYSHSHEYSDESKYITLLALMQGHLYAGKNLYQQHNLEYAKKHMKHPQSELYQELLPILHHRKEIKFTEILNRFVMKIENEAKVVEVNDLFTITDKTITQMVRGEKPSPQIVVEVIINLVRTAGEEYREAIDKNRNVINPQEYQDAWGFVHVAHDYTNLITREDGEKIYKIADKVHRLVETLEPAWPEIHGKKRAGLKPEKFFEVVAKLEQMKADI